MNREHKLTYLQYFRLGETAYREKVRFYEEHPDAIASLYYEDKIDIDLDYLICLFEIGRYERFLSKVDAAIEQVIMDNIYEFGGENIYEELLFRKAACLYQIEKYDECGHLLRQLVKINPSNRIYIGLLNIVERKIHTDAVTTIKALAMASFLIVVCISLVRILFEPFLDVYISPLITVRTGLFILGISCLVGLEVYFQLKLYRETGMFSYGILNRIFNTKV
ncbi:MAG: hypothetical protein J5I52_09820 [Saprospiraceae bacterium]|nr:MAG: hypothetical protein UZ09_BCD002001167 [Bacteroidetes bacterium OLB9]MCO6464430.1 hypothetical protein [Saprospiraceae bacterium]MCZ2336598.1 hypothetical protein [Chitinophagales bacterium]